MMDKDNRMEYQAGIPVGRHPSYIIRKADAEAIQVLRGMGYLLLIEPRQQGKTSLLFRLQKELSDRAFVYIDVSTLNRSSEEAWYRSLCSRIVKHLEVTGAIASRTLGSSLPTDHEQWDEFLYELCRITSKPIVLMLDEIGAAEFPNSSSFFAVIRAALTARGAHPDLERVTFALAGAFHPGDLIRDKAISPFNVAQRVRLTDFTLQQVQELVQKAPPLSQHASALARRIYFWTDGHPYLTQLFCSRLLDGDTGDVGDESSIDLAVDDLAKVLRQEGEGALRNIVNHFDKEPELAKYFYRILRGEGIEFYPGQYPQQANLELLGLIKKDHRGDCVARNEYYRRAFEQRMGTIFDVFICYRRRGGAEFAHSVKDELEKCGLRVFLDKDNLGSGPFPDQLYRIIEATPGFVVLLSDGSLDSCVSDEDWVRKEVVRALQHSRPGRSIVPLLMIGFQFPDHLPEEMKPLKDHQNIDLNQMSRQDAFQKLCQFLRSASS